MMHIISQSKFVPIHRGGGRGGTRVATTPPIILMEGQRPSNKFGPSRRRAR